MIPFLLTGFACAVALVVFAAVACAVVHVLRRSDVPRAQARDRNALKGRW